jgi:hypothetical protein
MIQLSSYHEHGSFLRNTPRIERQANDRASEEKAAMSKSTYRIVMRGRDGQLENRDYHSAECIAKMHTQVGIDDCSTDLTLRGLPVFRGLIGPMPEDKHVVRYETPEVFESLTKEWSVAKSKRRSRSRAKLEMQAAESSEEAAI